jgi:hypothetical protein
LYSSDIKLEHKLNPQVATAPKHKIQLYQATEGSNSGSNAHLGNTMLLFASEVNLELLIYELKGASRYGAQTQDPALPDHGWLEQRV